MTRRRLRRAALLAVLGSCATAVPAAAVTNGEPVDPATVPWFASVNGCGGTLVAPDRVLTAAHCIAGASVAEVHVVIGGVAPPIAHVALHHGWRHRNGAGYRDDVAIVGLAAPVAGVTPVTLGGAAPPQATILGTGRPVAPGTGHSEAEGFDGTLRSAPLRLISDRECARAFAGYRPSDGERFDPRMLCAIDADGRAPLYSGCNGDSGGPLWTGTAQAPVQLGVVSWGGDRCGADHLPSVFADVSRYRAFITDPSPTWAPARTGRAAVTGTAHPGRRLRCAMHGYRPERGATVTFAWRRFARNGGGALRTVGTGRSYTVARADRGQRVSCMVEASNAGGFVIAGAASRAVPRTR